MCTVHFVTRYAGESLLRRFPERDRSAGQRETQATEGSTGHRRLASLSLSGGDGGSSDTKLFSLIAKQFAPIMSTVNFSLISPSTKLRVNIICLLLM